MIKSVPLNSPTTPKILHLSAGKKKKIFNKIKKKNTKKQKPGSRHSALIGSLKPNKAANGLSFLVPYTMFFII